MKISIITSIDDFYSLKPAWNTILAQNNEHNLYYSHDWYSAILSFCKLPICSLFILCVQQAGQIIAVFPCCMVKNKPRLIQYNSIEFIGNIYSAYRGGVVLKGMEAAVAKAVTDFLLKNRRMWDILYLEGIPTSDPFLNALQKSFKDRRIISRTVEQYANMVVDIKSGMCSADYWKSRKKHLRQHVHRYMNRMSREGRFNVLLTTHSARNIHAAMDHYDDIYANSWKEPECEPLFHRKLADYLSERNQFRLFTLYFQKNESIPSANVSASPSCCECDMTPCQCTRDGYFPIATAYCAVNGSYACILKTAYRQDHATYSAGTVLTWFVIQWLLDQDRVSVIDFQKDGDAYKYKWGRFNDMHMLFKAASPISPMANLETWGEKTVIPLLREKGLIPKLACRIIPKTADPQ